MVFSWHLLFLLDKSVNVNEKWIKNRIQFYPSFNREPKMGINDENDQVSYKYIGDALALRGDERRSTLR